MFQIFERFKVEYIDKLLALNKRYLVSQTYLKAFDHFEESRINLLFSDYDDKGLALIHYKAIKNDKYAYILDLANSQHKEKIKDMMDAKSSYRIFWAIVDNMDNVKKRMDFKYKNNIRRYIETNTNWRIGSDEVIRPSLQVIFGELFITLKRGSQTIRVKFDEIEKA